MKLSTKRILSKVKYRALANSVQFLRITYLKDCFLLCVPNNLHCNSPLHHQYCMAIYQHY